MREQIRFVIAGHVDHGKSTLIGRLLYDTGSLSEGKLEEIRRISEELGRPLEFGFICDNLEEERALAQTIDTTQTFFRTKDRRFVIIDAPGHKELTKNMLTGASQADGAVLMVDAMDGLQEQTRRHAYLLGLLGIGQIIVAINKMDLVGYDKDRFLQVKKDILAFLRLNGQRPRATVPVSAMRGDNVARRSKDMKWYQGPTVLECLKSLRSAGHRPRSPLRFPVQDRYCISGEAVYVGRVSSGSVRKGDRLVFLPSGKKAAVSGIKVLWKRKRRAEAGECIGITLSSDPGLTRGEVALPAGARTTAVKSVSANVFWMSSRPARTGEALTMRLSTQEIPCKMKIREVLNIRDLGTVTGKRRLDDTDLGKVGLVSRSPFVAETFKRNRELGRFVLLRGPDVVAGGIVTEA